MTHPNEPSIERLEVIRQELEANHPEDFLQKKLAIDTQIRRRNKEEKKEEKKAE